MKYTDKTFTVAAPGTDEYRDNWDRIFGPKDVVEPTTKRCPECKGSGIDSVWFGGSCIVCEGMGEVGA